MVSMEKGVCLVELDGIPSFLECHYSVLCVTIPLLKCHTGFSTCLRYVIRLESPIGPALLLKYYIKFMSRSNH